VTVLSVVLIVAGLLFTLIGAVGALRMPDFYTRAHAIGVLDTLGTLLILGGLVLSYGFSLTSAKLFFLLLFIYVANPTVTHVFMRAAMRSGLKPWTAENKVSKS